jgi:signal transduction histidine kinase
MNDPNAGLLLPMLDRQLVWVISLRWYAGAAIVLFDLVQWVAGPFFSPPGVMVAVGLTLLAVNGGLALLARRNASPSAARLGVLAWSQLVADLLALTVVVVLTGGIGSPLIAFSVFPMIFASLFLPRVQAYAGVLLAVVLLAVALRIAGRWPGVDFERMTAIAWILTLLFSVHLVHRVTRGLFRRERERIEQERRLMEMKERVMEQERAMARVEKLVSIGQLAAGVAHEISNPLAGIDGLLQLLQRSPDKPRPEAVARLRDQVARINATVRQMTALAHPDLGRPERVDPAVLVRETIDILRYDHRLREIAVDLDLAPDLPPLRVNPRALQQALMNLLINAADALEQTESPRIGVRVQTENGRLRIAIADNGPGIRDPDKDRIFEPFVTTKPVGQGTGLGLPISRELVAAQGGRLLLESEPGFGAVFTIELPHAAWPEIPAERSGGTESAR